MSLTAVLGERGRPLRLLCLGAHCDDIEIGAGGTILRLLAERPGSEVTWMVLSSTPEREREALASAGAFLTGATGGQRVLVRAFRDGYLPSQSVEVKDAFEELKATVRPQLILTHHRHDRHQDHRLIAELTWNTFRDHLIAEYEIPKYEGDLGAPNVFMHLSREIVESKVAAILQNFPSQCTRQWFSEDAFLALLRLRGIESNAPTRYAEAFYCRKMVLGGEETGETSAG